MQTVKRSQILELFLPFIMDCSSRESMLFAKHLTYLEIKSSECESNQPNSRVNREMCHRLLCVLRAVPVRQAGRIWVQGWPVLHTLVPFWKTFFSSATLTRAERNGAKNWLCFLQPGRLPIPQASPSLPSSSLFVHPALLL